MIRIDRCVCYNTRFTELKVLAAQRGAQSFEELREHSPCGQGCGMCRPYIRAMLATGEVVFTRLINEAGPP